MSWHVPPAPEPPAGRSWYRRWWLAGAAGLAVLLVGCLAGAGLALLTAP
jgi:hypothetical protein